MLMEREHTCAKRNGTYACQCKGEILMDKWNIFISRQKVTCSYQNKMKNEVYSCQGKGTYPWQVKRGHILDKEKCGKLMLRRKGHTHVKSNGDILVSRGKGTILISRKRDILMSKERSLLMSMAIGTYSD